MKRVCLALVVVSVMTSIFVAGALAGSVPRIRINVPFTFQAGDQLMPAGKYLFEMPTKSGFATGSMLRISSPDGSICRNIHAMVLPGEKDQEWHVLFTRYGNSYFLNKVRNGDVGSGVFLSNSEKKLATEYAAAAKAIHQVDLRAVVSKAK